jgi:hypothetical protein
MRRRQLRCPPSALLWWCLHVVRVGTARALISGADGYPLHHPGRIVVAGVEIASAGRRSWSWVAHGSPRGGVASRRTSSSASRSADGMAGVCPLLPDLGVCVLRARWATASRCTNVLGRGCLTSSLTCLVTDASPRLTVTVGPRSCLTSLRDPHGCGPRRLVRTSLRGAASRFHHRGQSSQRRTLPHHQPQLRFRRASRRTLLSQLTVTLPCPPRLLPLKIASPTSWMQSRRS